MKLKLFEATAETCKLLVPKDLLRELGNETQSKHSEGVRSILGNTGNQSDGAQRAGSYPDTGGARSGC